ncbi:AAA family ATPase [Haliea sp. E17]|uniref:AAA family ATPase n=1 Tax=Haliea sp. E17 TaxID=3401576 RepID=UPI003AAA3F55
MKLLVEKQFVEAMAERYPDLSPYTDQLKFGNRAEIHSHQLSISQLGFLSDLYQQAGARMQGRAAQISTLKRALDEELRVWQEGELEYLVTGITEYLLRDAICGWLFQANVTGKPIAFLVSRIDYSPAGEEETGRILMELQANAMARIVNQTITIRERDIAGKTIAQIFADRGFFRETAELMDAYERSVQRYYQWRADYGRQFSGRGTGIFAEDPTASHRNTDWSRKSRVVLSSSGSPARLVNDEDIIGDRALTLDATGNILSKYLRKAGRSVNYDEQVEKAAEALVDGIPDTLFTRLPVHGYMLMFHLELHHHLWVHVDDIEPYEYQPELKQKLILPPEQTDLIDILTAEMDVLMDDIVEGKSGGTTVLCCGPAGVGKTLTAEVYAEIIQRPLYRVHSGQLGLNVAEMEKALKDTLTRAQRWGAVMLIDEADVYIKRRDDNLAANAVVGVFLRVLEYFNGLLFLTTNRTDDIDEAIVSRCIAVIRYAVPDREDRRRIWAVMTEQFGLDIAAVLLDTLADLFPEASGRDIKGLTKLVAKYCHHKSVAPTLEVFERCSIFRGLRIQS